MKVLDKIFGNKVVLITGEGLWGFASHEAKWLFNPSASKEDINMVVKTMNKSFRVTERKEMRTKKHVCPENGKYRVIQDSKVIRWYD